MEALKKYMHRLGKRRLLLMLLGNVFIGMGIGIFKYSGMGNDPCNGMVMAVSERLQLYFPNVLIIFNLTLLVFQFLFGRKYIGLGTLVNCFLCGYAASFTVNLLQGLFGIPAFLWVRLLVVLCGVLVVSFGVSLYQSCEAGISPYDSVTLMILDRKPKLPYFGVRIVQDGLCALLCFLNGGIIGVGTLVSMFGLGPFIQGFDRITRPMAGSTQE